MKISISFRNRILFHFSRFAALLCLLTIGVANAWGTDPSVSDLDFGTPIVDEDFSDLATVSCTTTVAVLKTDQTAFGAFNCIYNNNTANTYAIVNNANGLSGKSLSLSVGSGSPLIAHITTGTWGNKGAFRIKTTKTSKNLIGFYSETSGNAYTGNKSSIYIKNTAGELAINNGSGTWNTIGTYTTDIIDICVIYNNTNSSDSYNSISLASETAHVYVNGNAVMNVSGTAPKNFSIAGLTLTSFRVLPQAMDGNKCYIDDVQIWNALPTAAETTRKVYLDATHFGDSDGAQFGIYSWENGSSPTNDQLADEFMEKVTDCHYEHLYVGEIPIEHDRLIFLRNSSSATSPVKDAGSDLWNKTVDITIPADKDFFTISSGGTGTTYTGTWSVFSPYYEVSFNNNAVFSTTSSPSTQCVVEGGKVSSPTNPKALGKTVSGWYEEAGCTNEWVFATNTVSNAKTLYANWDDVDTKTIYLDASTDLSGSKKWDADGVVLFAHAYIDGTSLAVDVIMTGYLNYCDNHIYAFTIPGNATHVTFARCHSGATSVVWTGGDANVYNQISGKTVEAEKNLYTITDWGSATLENEVFTPTQYTISFVAGTGGDGTMSDDDVICDDDYTIKENEFTQEGKILSGWIADKDVTINSSTVTAGSLIEAEATIENVRDNITLTAQWIVDAPTITASNGSTALTPETYVTITVPTATTVYYTTDGSTPAASNGTAITASTSVIFAKGVTVKAIAIYGGDASTVISETFTFGRIFTLAGSGTTFTDDDAIIITNAASTKALSTTQADNNRPQTSVTASDNKITIAETNDSVQIIHLQANSTNWMMNVGQDQYLYAASSSYNYLRTNSKTTAGDNGIWAISIDASNEASVVAQGTNTHKTMRYNSLFSCYESGQNPIRIYRYHCSGPYLNCNPAEINSFDYMEGYGPSLAQKLEVHGYNLTGDLTVACPTGYEISYTASNSDFGTGALTLTRDGSNRVNTTIYIRLAKGKSTGAYHTHLSISGGGITTNSIPVTGSVTSDTHTGTLYQAIIDEADMYPGDEMIILNATGTYSMGTEGTNNRTAVAATEETFAVTDNIVDFIGGNVQNIVLEAGSSAGRMLMKVGDNSYLYAASNSANQLKAKPNPGVDGQWKFDVKATGIATITAPESSNRDTIQFNKTGDGLFSCYSNYQAGGDIILYYKSIPNILPGTLELTGLTTTTGSGSSAAQSFTFRAKNLSGDVTISAPTNFEVCLTENGSYTSSVTVSPTDGRISTTTVWVKMQDVQVETPSGNITLSATGATNRTIAVSGTITKHAVTYHSASEDDHVAYAWHNGSVDAYTPADCANGKAFVGWYTAEVDELQQTDPTTNATGAIGTVTGNVDLYAVFAGKNGGKVIGTHTLTEDFESYSSSNTYTKINNVFNNSNGLSWQIDYGNVTSTGASYFGITNNRDVILYPYANYRYNVLKSTSVVNDVLGVSLWAAKNHSQISGTLWWSTNGTTWSSGRSQDLVITSLISTNVHFNEKRFSTPQNIYIKVTGSQVTPSSGNYLYIDNIVFTIADRSLYYTDYSTTCTMIDEAVDLTWVDSRSGDVVTGEKSEEVEPGWFTLPTLSSPNYQFLGWKATIEDDEKSDVYAGGEEFLVNHPVTFTAQWEQVFTAPSEPDNMPVVSASGLTVMSSPHTTGSVTILRADAATPTAVITGSDASLFTVTFGEGITEDETTVFPYAINYTPDAYNTGHSATLAFQDGDGTAGTTGVTSSTITITGRSLPQHFVIAALVDNSYLALPENTNSVSTISPFAVDVVDGQAINVNPLLEYSLSRSEESNPKTANDTCLFINSHTSRLYGNSSGLRSATGGTGATYHWYITYNSANGTYRIVNGSLVDSQEAAITYNNTSGVYKFSLIKTGTAGAAYFRDLYILPIVEETGDRMDIVDWSSTSLTLNMNGYTVTDGVDATVSEGDKETLTQNTRYSWGGTTNDRTFDVTLSSPTAGSYLKLLVEWGTTKGSESSECHYRVPYIYTANTTLSAVGTIKRADDIVVRSGTLTIDVNLSVRNIYVYPGAGLTIKSGKTLSAEKIYLRTEPFSAAVLTDNGTLNVRQMYYTRIVANKTNTFLLALPYASTIAEMRLTTGQEMTYGTKWVLYKYDGARRAESGADGSNWVKQTSITEIAACQGYELLSGSAYYREYCFPVSYEKIASDATVTVAAHSGTASMANPINGGWNHICSPYTHVYIQDFGETPEEAIKLTELTEDNQSYWQHVMTTILPTQPFYYQAAADGELTFGDYISYATSDDAPSRIGIRSAQHSIPTQWLTLRIADTEGREDETNLYFHPDKFTAGYEVSYDLEKMLGFAQRPQLYTIASCGKLAFNALPDSVAQNRVALGYYAATNGTYTISLDENNYMHRMEHVWLVDEQDNALIDMLHSSYTFTTQAGENTTRLYLFATFHTNETPTDIVSPDNDAGDEPERGRKFVIDGCLYIQRGNRIFDATGKEVRL